MIKRSRLCFPVTVPIAHLKTFGLIMSTKQSQMVAEKYFYAETVGFPSQKQKILSWKVSERL